MRTTGDQVAIGALSALSLMVAIGGGFLDPLIDALNSNSGAIMVVAATLTAGVTVALVFLNRSSWRLYELERNRDEAIQARIADECSRAQSKVSRLARRWRRIEFPGENQIVEAFEFTFFSIKLETYSPILSQTPQVGRVSRGTPMPRATLAECVEVWRRLEVHFPQRDRTQPSTGKINGLSGSLTGLNSSSPLSALPPTHWKPTTDELVPLSLSQASLPEVWGKRNRQNRRPDRFSIG